MMHRLGAEYLMRPLLPRTMMNRIVFFALLLLLTFASRGRAEDLPKKGNLLALSRAGVAEYSPDELVDHIRVIKWPEFAKPEFRAHDLAYFPGKLVVAIGDNWGERTYLLLFDFKTEKWTAPAWLQPALGEDLYLKMFRVNDHLIVQQNATAAKQLDWKTKKWYALPAGNLLVSRDNQVYSMYKSMGEQQIRTLDLNTGKFLDTNDVEVSKSGYFYVDQLGKVIGLKVRLDQLMDLKQRVEKPLNPKQGFTPEVFVQARYRHLRDQRFLVSQRGYWLLLDKERTRESKKVVTPELYIGAFCFVK